MSYDTTNAGILQINDKGDNPKRPDRTGTIDIEGVVYKLAGWIGKDPKGATVLRLRAQRKDHAGPRGDSLEDVEF